MDSTKEFFVFISYSSKDDVWALWLRDELEKYQLPASFNGRTDVRDNLREVFRDRDVLSAGPEWNVQVKSILENSVNLIVICSPHAAQSEAVEEEVKTFIKLGKESHIFPFIVEGDKPDDCFPPSLNHSKLGGDVNKDGGRDAAFVKVVAGMLNVDFPSLWLRYERNKAEQERKEREEKDKLLRLQSRFVAEKVIDITNESCLAQLLALEVLPNDLENPDKPFTIEAEHALRQVASKHSLLLRGHKLGIDDLAFSSDEKRIASASGDITLKIWETETGLLLRTIQFNRPFGRCLAFFPDDTVIVVAFHDGTLEAWDTETGECLWQIDLISVFDGELEISPCAMAISPNGALLVLASSGGKILMLNLVDGTTATDSMWQYPADTLEFSRDGKYLIAVSMDGFVLWDFENGADARKEFDESAKELIESTFATFSPNGKLLAIVANTPLSSKVVVYNVVEGSLSYTLNYDYEHNEDPGERVGVIVAAAFDNNGKDIITVNNVGEIKVRDIETGNTLDYDWVSSVWVEKVVFSANKDYIGMAVNQNDVIVRSLKSSYITKRILVGKEQELYSISYSPDGSFILAGSGAYEKGRLMLWNVASGQLAQELIGHQDRIFSATFSPKGDLIVSASYDGEVRVWNPKTGENIKTLKSTFAVNEQTAFSSVSFSPDGVQVAVSTYNGDIVLWDIESGLITHKFKDTYSPMWSVSFSPDGTKIVSGSLDRDVKIWDISKGTLFKRLTGHTNIVRFVTYSPDGKQITSASDDNTIICWDAESGGMIWQILGFGGNIRSVAYSPDGKNLVAGILDPENPIVVLDAQTGKKIVVLRENMAGANFAVFSPDNKQIASAGTDGVIRIWDFPPLQELINQTRERFKDRSLTSEERRMYYLE